MIRVLGLWLAIILLGIPAAGYLANTFLYLTPPNPIKVRLLALINGIEHPLFAQNWHLFAPNPVRTNFVLTARCRFGHTLSDWQDVTTPLLARHHRSRTSPMGRLLRVQQNAIHLVLGWNPDDWRPLVCRRDPRHPLCGGQDPSTIARREMGRIVLRRVASATCSARAGGRRVDAVQVRVLIHTPPPWSQRHLPAAAGTTRYLPLPWDAYEPW